jgi:hypothetical protein
MERDGSNQATRGDDATSEFWLAAVDDFRNWLRLGGPPSPCGLWRDIAP